MICREPHRYAPLQFKIIPGRKSGVAKEQSVDPNTFTTYKLAWVMKKMLGGVGAQGKQGLIQETTKWKPTLSMFPFQENKREKRGQEAK